MKSLFLSCLFFSFYLLVRSQTDTIVIRNIKFYKEGKVNILKTPSGKKIKVKLQNGSGWKDHDEIDTTLYWDRQTRKLKPDIDTGQPQPLSPLPIMALAASYISANNYTFKSYVDPHLTSTQKTNIQANSCKNAKFAGLSRAKVKTSIVSGDMHSYSTLIKFINTLPGDPDMETVIDALDKPWQQRAIQELKNVTVKNVFLKAYKKEDDNDYHLIICNSTETVFFTAEISGLPGNRASSYQALKNVRTVFETFPGPTSCGGSYVELSTPIKILQIKGSIFFDTDHAGGTVGPSGNRPKTAWEIHPITSIQFQ